MALAFPGLAAPIIPQGLASSGAAFVDLLPALGGMVLFIVGGFLLVAWLRRRLHAANDPPDGFTLDGLRRLHAAGDLSDEEYARAKQALIDRIRGAGADSSENDGDGEPQAH